MVAISPARILSIQNMSPEITWFLKRSQRLFNGPQQRFAAISTMPAMEGEADCRRTRPVPPCLTALKSLW
jgi:hypothetical protein